MPGSAASAQPASCAPGATAICPPIESASAATPAANPRRQPRLSSVRSIGPPPGTCLEQTTANILPGVVTSDVKWFPAYSERRFGQGLRQRRVRAHHVQHLFAGGLEAQQGAGVADQLGGPRADDVDAQDLVVLLLGDDFD